MINRRLITILLASTLTFSLSLTAFAGQWMKDDVGYWWQEDDGSYPVNTFKWIDANGDKSAEGYYFDENGYVYDCNVLPSNMTIEQYMQSQMSWQSVGTTPAGANHSEGYDPAHPLAGKIDEWNLRLPYNLIGPGYVYSSNVQTMLTGQMDQYYMAPVGYSTDKWGNTIHTRQEDYDRAKASEQFMYDWFCNWLNSFDFENMSEMERAKEIQKLLWSEEYDYNYQSGGDPIYRVLVEKKGICGEFAITACTLAKALGLKSTTSGFGDHATFYIQVDGLQYLGSNNGIDLNTPYSNIYCGY